MDSLADLSPDHDNDQGFDLTPGGLPHDDGGGDDKTQNAKKRRNRKPVTCAQCRKRKLKCDRGSPCGACRDRNEGHLCEWEGAIRLPQSNYTRDQEAMELRSQLDRFEGLLSILSTTATDTNLPGLSSIAGLASSLQGGRPRDLDIERTSAAEALGLLAGTSNTGANGSSASTASHLLGPIANNSQTIDQIISILPHRIELDLVIQAFLGEGVATLPIVHAPSFRERYRLFDRTSARNDPFFVALLFALSGWETYFKTLDPRSSRSGASVKEGTARTYVNAAMEALHVGGFMETPSMDSVRTLLVLHLYYSHQDSPSSAFILSSAILVAQSLGLNRDPALYHRFGYLEGEERRRLWTLLYTSDWIDNIGRTYTCSPAQFDTYLPSNARDEEVTDQGVVSRPLAIATPMLHLLFKAQVAALARAITDRVFAIQLPPSWATILELNSELTRIDNSLPPVLAFEWVNGAVKPFGDETTPMDSARVLVHLLLRQQFIRLHRPFLTRAYVDARFAFAREKCCWAARYILAIHRGLGDDYRATRSWPLVFHTLNALVILAIDLYQDPDGAFSGLHRTDVTATLKLLESRVSKSKLVKETIRVVSILLKRSLRSDKKRKHDDLLGESDYGSQSGPTPPGSSPANLAFILSGEHSVPTHNQMESILRPFEPNSPFSRALPVPMSVDPLSSLGPTGASDLEWAQLWTVLGKHRSFYALPDQVECEELRRMAGGGGGTMWPGGIDLLF